MRHHNKYAKLSLRTVLTDWCDDYVCVLAENICKKIVIGWDSLEILYRHGSELIAQSSTGNDTCYWVSSKVMI